MKGQEEKKESVLGAIKKYQSEDKENQKKRETQAKKLRDKYMVGVVLGLHRLFICKSSNKENIFMKKIHFMV